jgi:hypothetical protein
MKPDAKPGHNMKVFIDAELRQVNLLPPDELHAILEPWMAPLRQSLELVGQLQQSWTHWIEQNWEQLAAFSHFIQQAPGSTTACRGSSPRRITNVGWTQTASPRHRRICFSLILPKR